MISCTIKTPYVWKPTEYKTRMLLMRACSLAWAYCGYRSWRTVLHFVGSRSKALSLINHVIYKKNSGLLVYGFYEDRHSIFLFVSRQLDRICQFGPKWNCNKTESWLGLEIVERSVHKIFPCSTNHHGIFEALSSSSFASLANGGCLCFCWYLCNVLVWSNP